MTMLDHEMPASLAAQHLQDALEDGRSYYSWLQDMRRGKRECRIPFHKDRRGRAWYYKTDLEAFIAAELAKSVAPRHAYLVEREDSAIGSWLAPTKRLSVVH